MSKIIIAHNQDNLPTAKYTDFIDLQGDLKTLPKENQEKLKNSIINYGIRFPAFIWQSEGKKYIVDAHQRKKVFAILEKEGWIIPEVPYTNIFAKNKKEAAELLLQVNSRYGEYNPDTSFFKDMQIDLSFIENIKIPELDIKLEELESKIVEDEVPEPPTEPLSKTGDLWLCGKHRILCGGATKEANILKLMDDKKADLLLTDPPYGIGVVKQKMGGDHEVGFVGHNGVVKARQYHVFEGENKPYHPKPILPYGNKKIIFGANCFANELPNNSHWIVWDKKCEKGSDLNNFSDVELAWTNIEKKSCTIYRYLWSGLLREGKRDIELFERVHPTQKPVGLYANILKDYSKEKELILDLYLGSGSLLIACEQTNRILYGTEIDPYYIDVILDRYAKFTGDDPIRESDGVKWSELKSSSGKRTD